MFVLKHEILNCQAWCRWPDSTCRLMCEVMVNFQGIQDFIYPGTALLTAGFEQYYQFALYIFLQCVVIVKGGCAKFPFIKAFLFKCPVKTC